MLKNGYQQISISESATKTQNRLGSDENVIVIQCTELAGSSSHLELRNKVFRHFLQQINGRLVLTEEHQLQIQVPLQKQALGNQAHPHYATQRACGLIFVLAIKRHSREEGQKVKGG